MEKHLNLIKGEFTIYIRNSSCENIEKVELCSCIILELIVNAGLVFLCQVL